MTSVSSFVALLALADPSTPAVAPWWQSPGAGWLLATGVVVASTLVSWMIAKSLKLPDMWGRITAVLMALAAGGTICWMGWPPRLGIDLKGGLILVYEVAAGRQTQTRVDDSVAGI